MEETNFFTVKEVANYLNQSEAFIRKKIRQRKIPYCRIGSSIRFERPKIITWACSQGTNTIL